MKKIRELLANLEHEQWMAWTKYLYANHFHDTIEKLANEKWNKNWKSYNKLSEKLKDKDREWADKVITIIEGNLK